METAQIDFRSIDEKSLAKIRLAKGWLEKKFPQEAETVEENLKYFLSMNPPLTDDFKDTLLIHSLTEKVFGEYAITADFADEIRKENLAARLVRAAYTVLYRSRGIPMEVALQLAEDKRKKVADWHGRRRLEVLVPAARG